MSVNQKEAAAKKDRYKVHPGEPGCNAVTDFKDGRPIMENPPVALAPPSSPLLPYVIQEQIEGKPVILSPRDEIAHYRLIFVRALEAEISKKDKPISEAIRRFLFGYNSGLLLPIVRKKLGPVSWRTAYRFREAFDKGGVESLAPEYGKKGISKITEHEKNLLLTLLLHPNRLKVAYVITLTKNYLKRQGIESLSSDRTLRRFADQFEKEHNDIWVLHREGEKALDDKVLPYIERDRNLLDVGEGLVADGHRLNFQMTDAFTGKPCRAAVVFFWDWRSAYPLGWEIMPEENIQCIFTAFRNAVLTLGKMPKWILIDNGKAFKARLFTSDINLTETEIVGMFARLNINVHFASPYNAKSKPIERFFETFGDQFERLMESFIGSSIEDKPAWTKRNEKLARSLHNPKIPIFSEINDRMFEWREFYVDQPSRGLGGQTPREIFKTGKGPGVDPAELVHLMMPREIKRITRNGIDLFGCYWHNEALYGLRDHVVIKYSLSDLSQIYCFYKNEFLCTLKPLPKTHPMASESGTPKDMEDVKRRIAQKRGLKKQTVKLYKMLGRKADALPWKEIVQEIPDVNEIIEKIEAEKPRPPIISPFIDGIDCSNEVGPLFSQEPNLTDSKSQKNEIVSPFIDEQIQKDLPTKGPAKKLIIVDPRTGLSRPSDGRVFKNEFEYYDWYRAIEEMSPGVLNEADWGKIETYEGSEEWEDYYGRSKYARMAKAASDSGNSDLESRNQEVRK
jgi:putative transposase